MVPIVRQKTIEQRGHAAFLPINGRFVEPALGKRETVNSQTAHCFAYLRPIFAALSPYEIPSPFLRFNRPDRLRLRVDHRREVRAARKTGVPDDERPVAQGRHRPAAGQAPNGDRE